MRQVEGTRVASLIRDLPDGRVDVSQIARGFGGCGHRQAAGFTTDMELGELIERLRTEVGAQL